MRVQETEDAYGWYNCLNVICHETSHQWFGDYITLEDFGEYTVNEGVTSYMEYLCMQAVDPAMLTQPLRHLYTTPAGAAVQLHTNCVTQSLAIVLPAHHAESTADCPCRYCGTTIDVLLQVPCRTITSNLACQCA